MSLPKKRKVDRNYTMPIDEGQSILKNPEKICIEDKLSVNQGFLFGYDIYLHPASLSKNRKTIFERQIVSNGGKLVQNLSHFEGSKRGIILLDDDLIDKYRLTQMMEKIVESSSRKDMCFQFLALRWLSLCLEKSCYVEPTIDFVLRNMKCEGQTSIKQANSENENNATCSLESVKRSNDNIEKSFVCAYSSKDPQNKLNLNVSITEELSKLAAAYKNSNDQWRCFAYEKAIASIKRHPRPILTRNEAAKIRGVGEKMADKVAEILHSGQLQKVNEVCKDEKAEVLSLFNRIWGVGPSTADQWYYQGMKSLDDLRNAESQHPNFLNKNQKVGLELFDDLDERMHRSEASNIESYVKKSVLEIDQHLEVIACGSYRRGKDTCGDLDILITHPNDEMVLGGLFDKLISKLHKEEFLTHDLTLQKDGNQKKYLGVCKLKTTNGEKSKHRRLDIIVVPPKEKATALMYFTGSAHFNRSMRLLATKKEMALSEHSLRKNVIRGGQNNKEKLNAGLTLDTPTEESVFRHLGLPYREPFERDH